MVQYINDNIESGKNEIISKEVTERNIFLRHHIDHIIHSLPNDSPLRQFAIVAMAWTAIHLANIRNF